MRYTGPKDRLSRREGVDLFGKGVRLRRLNIPPGMHGQKGTRLPSGYSRQLREKQKAKRIYGVSEKQFKKYVKEAARAKVNFLGLVERRLDNVVYRLGFAPTRFSARQMVSHRHVLVDGKILNIPSYLVQKEQVISLDSKALAIPEVKKMFEREPDSVSAWLARKAAVGKIVRYPVREDVTEPISEQEIIEFYSR